MKNFKATLVKKKKIMKLCHSFQKHHYSFKSYNITIDLSYDISKLPMKYKLHVRMLNKKSTHLIALKQCGDYCNTCMHKILKDGIETFIKGQG